MKPFYSKTLHISLLVFCVQCVLAQGFEGVINMTKTVADTQKVTKLTVKGDSVLIQMFTDNGEVRVINDRAQRMTTSLFEKEGKKYAFISRQADQKTPELDERQKLIMELAKEQIKMEITEETRQIGSYLCTKIIGEDHKEYIEAWITEDMDVSLFDLFPHEQSKESQEIDLQRMIWEEGFVIEYWTKSKSSGVVEKIVFEPVAQGISVEVFDYPKHEYYEFDQNTLNELYSRAGKDPEKMKELRELLSAFQSSN